MSYYTNSEGEEVRDEGVGFVGTLACPHYGYSDSVRDLCEWVLCACGEERYWPPHLAGGQCAFDCPKKKDNARGR